MTSSGRALHGHLDLVCERDDAGRTFVARQSFRVPMHFSKPYWNGTTLILNAVNPTAGLFSGDTVEVSVHAAAGASALFTSPSASRVHRARDGEPDARVQQRFSVAPDGWLDVCPEMLIAQAGARYEQHTALEVAPGGGLLFFDCLAPGRVASGEVFAFERVRSRTRLTVDGRLLAAETCHLTRDAKSLHPLRVHHAHSYHATWFAIFPEVVAAPPLLAAVAEINHEKIVAGASALNDRAFVGKILTADSLSLRRAVLAVREMVYRQAHRPRPDWRKL